MCEIWLWLLVIACKTSKLPVHVQYFLAYTNHQKQNKKKTENKNNNNNKRNKNIGKQIHRQNKEWITNKTEKKSREGGMCFNRWNKTWFYSCFTY